MARKRYVIREVPHPFKKGDKVRLLGGKGSKAIVKSTSWQYDEAYVNVLPYVDGQPPTNLGVPGYNFRAVAVEHLPAIEQLGELSDV